MEATRVGVSGSKGVSSTAAAASPPRQQRRRRLLHGSGGGGDWIGYGGRGPGLVDENGSRSSEEDALVDENGRLPVAHWASMRYA
jgi:hypothetical protein